jgi:hypothetical protein
LSAGGESRMFHMANANAENVRTILLNNVAKESALHTDESRLYTSVGATFGEHHTVKHSAGEYVRYEDAPLGAVQRRGVCKDWNLGAGLR